MTAIATSENRTVARPLHVLVPLIKKDLDAAKDAADRAATPYYVSAGEKMIEAKTQLGHGEFGSWLKRNFNITDQWAGTCMRQARATLNIENESARPPTISEAIRQSGGKPRGAERGGASWHGPIKNAGIPEAIERASNICHLHEESLKREAEREAERKLAIQLIDIGYKALATKLHPDHGGSREAMARLNHVRDRLKKFV